MAKAVSAPKVLFPGKFCPGCGHGVFVRLIHEIFEEKGLTERNVCAIGVGCSANYNAMMKGGNMIEGHHGRVPNTARGVKSILPDVFVWTYQGDGDAYAIGMGETILAAANNYPVTVFVINNNNYGMTGGQTAPTTMQGQVTTTAQAGYAGSTFNVVPLLCAMDSVSYVARGTTASAAEIRKLKGYLRKAVDLQMEQNKYAFVEILSPCPTNWKKPPLEACDWILNEVTKVFPLGEFKK
ncbi:thiamine pyrophosphate-dependent enzyme [Lachnospiraceae bacterium ZAX-1]